MKNTPAPGWFPDAKIPGQLRWWDGNAWTEHVHVQAAPPAPPAGQPGHAAAEAAPLTPAASGPSAPSGNRVTAWMSAHKVLTGIAAFIVFLMLVGAVGGDPQDTKPASASATKKVERQPLATQPEDVAADDEATSDETSAAAAAPSQKPSATPKPKPAPKPVNPYGPQPPQQLQFIKLAQTAMDVYANASNDLKAGAALSNRNRAMCSLVGAGRVAMWSGTVTTLDSNGDGYGIVTIEIAPDIEVSTWNNAFSDVFDDTLIKPGPLFDKIVNLEEGQTVRFAGQLRPGTDTCVNDSRLTQAGKVEDPSFIIRFADINAVR